MTGRELDRHVRAELGTLSKDNATQVARHLVMTFRLLDEDPSAALVHAMAAQRRAGRVGLVREATGLAAYRAGEYEQALRELRTARRLTGSQVHLPVMADCERGLGRPEKALAVAASPEARQLDRAGQLELLMVAAGARQDLGQHDAAVVLLQVPELTAPGGIAHARLLSAYADALAAAGRDAEAAEWLRRAAAADVDGDTGAAERAGITDDDAILDVLGDGEDDGEDDVEGAALGGVEHPVVPALAVDDRDAADEQAADVPEAPESADPADGHEGTDDGGDAAEDAPEDTEDAVSRSSVQGVLFSDATTADRATE